MVRCISQTAGTSIVWARVFRENSSNGLLFDREGRLVACETKNRRVTRTERNGFITVLADRYRGGRFNSPNDLCMNSKGHIYFTDPRYGSREGMEILEEGGGFGDQRSSSGVQVEGVYRIDPSGVTGPSDPTAFCSLRMIVFF